MNILEFELSFFIFLLIITIILSTNNQERITCSWSNITVSRNSKTIKDGGRNTILHMQKGRIEPGRLLAVIGLINK
jgi:hypothetical protein